MTKREKEELIAILQDIEIADDRIDILERLYHTLKLMIYGN